MGKSDYTFRYKVRNWPEGTVKLSRICPFCGRILLDQRLIINDLAVAAGGENAAKLLNLTVPSALPDPLAPAARCPASAKGRRHVPNNMGQCPISIQVFFPDAPRSCEGMESPCVQAEAGVGMPLTRRPGPRSVPARCRRRATRGQRLQRFCAAVGAGPGRAPRPRPRGRPPGRGRRTPVPSHTARRRCSSERRP